MEGVKNGNIFATKPRFKSPSKTIRSLDSSYYSELWEWIPQNFRFPFIVAWLGNDTSTTQVGSNRVLLKPRESISKEIWISLSQRNCILFFGIERDDANDGAIT